MNILLCKNCGAPYEAIDIDENGFCINCPTELPLQKSPEQPLPMYNIFDLDAE